VGEFVSEQDLITEYGNWGEHPQFPLCDWQYEVNNNDTRAGYWHWVSNMIMNSEGSEWYRNYYRCPKCVTEWEGEWDCMCNDRCPRCGAEIEPYSSEEIDRNS